MKTFDIWIHLITKESKELWEKQYPFFCSEKRIWMYEGRKDRKTIEEGHQAVLGILPEKLREMVMGRRACAYKRCLCNGKRALGRSLVYELVGKKGRALVAYHLWEVGKKEEGTYYFPEQEVKKAKTTRTGRVAV